MSERHRVLQASLFQETAKRLFCPVHVHSCSPTPFSVLGLNQDHPSPAQPPCPAQHFITKHLYTSPSSAPSPCTRNSTTFNPTLGVNAHRLLLPPSALGNSANGSNMMPKGRTEG